MQLRVPTVMRVGWRVHGSPVLNHCTSRDWSRGGLFVHTGRPARFGQRITVRFRINSVWLEVDGTVMHRQYDGMGLMLDLAQVRVL